MTSTNVTGGCVCGQVRFSIDTPDRRVIACHCRQCRRMSGHVYAATAAARDGFAITEDKGLAWYQSSAVSRRGFCRNCGSSLFFDHGPDEPMGVAAGALDDDAGLELVVHIFTNEAGHYYGIDKDIPSFTAEAWSDGGWQRYRRDPG